MTSASVPATATYDELPWWLGLVQGVALLVLGALCLSAPGATIVVLVQLTGLYWLITGILGLIGLISDRSGWLWKAFAGVIGILAGMAIVAHPLWSSILVPTTLVIVIGIFGIVNGILVMIQSWGDPSLERGDPRPGRGAPRPRPRGEPAHRRRDPAVRPRAVRHHRRRDVDRDGVVRAAGPASDRVRGGRVRRVGPGSRAGCRGGRSSAGPCPGRGGLQRLRRPQPAVPAEAPSPAPAEAPATAPAPGPADDGGPATGA